MAIWNHLSSLIKCFMQSCKYLTFNKVTLSSQSDKTYNEWAILKIPSFYMMS